MPSGISRLSGVKPKTFALSACSQSPSGGLSTRDQGDGVGREKKKLCQERNIDLTAAE